MMPCSAACRRVGAFPSRSDSTAAGSAGLVLRGLEEWPGKDARIPGHHSHRAPALGRSLGADPPVPEHHCSCLRQLQRHLRGQQLIGHAAHAIGTE